MERVVDVPKDYYLGFTPGETFDLERFPLAFATPDGTDYASKKRKATVDSWCHRTKYVPTGKMIKYPHGDTEYAEQVPVNEDGEKHVIPNDFLTGFTFDKVVTRYETSNKVFRIQDPRGFTLEIYSDNMADVLLNGSIVRGEIQGRCCWGRSGGKMWLLRENSDEHTAWVASQIVTEKVKPVPGDWITTAIHTDSIYLGDFYQLSIGFTDIDRETRSRDGRGYHSSYPYYYSKSPRSMDYRLDVVLDEKPFKLLSYGALDHTWFTPIRTWGKKVAVTGHDDVVLRSKLIQLNPGGMSDKRHGTDNDEDMIYYDFKMYFATKDDMRAYVEFHAADGWSKVRAAWKKAHPDTKDYTYTLV